MAKGKGKEKKRQKKAKRAASNTQFRWRTFFKIWRTFGRHLLPYWGWLSLALLGLVLTVLVDLAQPWPLKFIIDYIATPDRPLPDNLKWLQTLGTSEERMLALTCERAGLADGQRVLDLGCGWGSVSLYAAAK